MRRKEVETKKNEEIEANTRVSSLPQHLTLEPPSLLQDLILEPGRSGQTRVDWLDEADLQRLTSLALLELDILFNEHQIHHRWRKVKKRKHSKEGRWRRRVEEEVGGKGHWA